MFAFYFTQLWKLLRKIDLDSWLAFYCITNIAIVMNIFMENKNTNWSWYLVECPPAQSGQFNLVKSSGAVRTVYSLKSSSISQNMNNKYLFQDSIWFICWSSEVMFKISEQTHSKQQTVAPCFEIKHDQLCWNCVVMGAGVTGHTDCVVAHHGRQQRMDGGPIVNICSDSSLNHYWITTLNLYFTRKSKLSKSFSSLISGFVSMISGFMSMFFKLSCVNFLILLLLLLTCTILCKLFLCFLMSPNIWVLKGHSSQK